MKRMQYMWILLLGLGISQSSFAQNLQNNWWITNGTVNTIVQQGSVVYLGGKFNSIGPEIKFGVQVDNTNGAVDNNIPLPNGEVRSVISDGAGGWYVGGNFTQIGAQSRNGLARINADGSIHAFNPNVTGTVNTLLLQGNTLYVGGSFSNIASANKSNLAAINVTTSDNIASFDPRVNGKVNTMGLSTDGNTLYVGGSFSGLRGNASSIPSLASRDNFAALSVANGQATALIGNTNGEVFSLLVQSSSVFIAGEFTLYNGVTHNYIAAVSGTTGIRDISFNPNPNSAVRVVARIGNNILAAGDFTIFGGQNRNYLASIDVRVSGTVATSWNPDPNGSVYSVFTDGQSAYIGGDFTAIGSVSRNRIAEINGVSGQVASWNPSSSNRVLAIAKNSTKLYLGGIFESMGCLTRNNAAAIDINTGIATSFDPNVNGEVKAIAFSGALVYLGGDFTGVYGQVRNRLAAVSANTGVPTTWNPGANGTVNTFAINCTNLFVGGNFNQLGGQTRSRLGAVNLNTGLATAWNPNVNGPVYALAFRGQNLFIGGIFSQIGVLNRANLAEIDLNTGTATAFNIFTNDTVYTILNNGRSVYLGGSFTQLIQNTVPFNRNRIADFEYRTTAAIGTIATNFNGTVRSLAIDNFTLYAAGDFNNVNATPTASLVTINTGNGSLGSFNNGLNRPMRAVSYYFGRISAGGAYQQAIPSFNSSYFHYISSSNHINLSSISGFICRGSNLTLNFTVNGTLNSGNVFQAYLSDADGGFGSPVLIGSLPSTNATSMQVTIPANTPPGSCYRIFITSSDNPITSNQTNNFQIFDDCNNLLAKLQPSDCGRTDFLLGGPVGIVNNVVWAQQGIPGVITYRFNIYDESGVNLLGTVNSSVRYMIPGNHPSIFALNGRYVVRVQIENIDGWGFEGDPCVIGFRSTPLISEVPNVSFNPAICGTTNFNLTSSNRISGIDLVNIVRSSQLSNYEVEVYNASGTQFLGQIFVPSGNLFIRNFPLIFQEGTGYQLRVRGYMGTTPGNWSSNCSIFIQGTAPSLPPTQIRSSLCGTSLFNINGTTDVSGVDFVNAVRVNGVTGYEFEIRNSSFSVVLGNISTNTSAKFYLRDYTNIFQAGTTYQVRVRSLLNTQVSAWSAYCQITTMSANPTVASTRIRQCGATITNNGLIRANDVNGATQYRFSFYSDAACSQLYAQALSNVNLSLTNVIPGLLPNNTYYVLVQARVGSVWGSNTIGDTCQLNISAPPLRLLANSASISAYPNPFVDQIRVDVPSGQGEISVFDLQGKLLYRQKVQATTETLNLDVKNGLYLVQITDSENQTVTFKMMKH